MTTGRRVVFVDRDGVLNAEIGTYVTSPEELTLLPGAADAVAHLNESGWPVIVFTNQAGVGRGFLTSATLETIHARLRAEVEAAGGKLLAVYACPHHPDDGCACRKPLPGMLFQAAQEYGLDLSQCVAVGDSPRDIAAGQAAGCRTILVLSGHTRVWDAAAFPFPHPDYVCSDLPCAADWILK